jgi:hypothetical protein
MDESGARPRQAVTVLDIVMLSPLECYAVVATMATDPDPVVSVALSDAVRRILARTRIGDTLT